MNRLCLHAANMAGAIVAFAVATLAAAPAAAANSVTDWHARAQHAIVEVAQQLPWNQTRSLAMVSGAAYDAVNAIDGTPYRPYLVAPAAHRSYSKDAAVATAAHDVLVGLLPAQRSSLDQQYDEALAAIPNGSDKAGGVSVGGQAADAMLAARENDGVDASQTWIVATQPGQWRPTPPLMVGISAQIGFMRTFAIPDADLFRSPRPNALTSAKYATDFNEVKSIGAASSTTRTSDQTRSSGTTSVTPGGRSSTRSPWRGISASRRPRECWRSWTSASTIRSSRTSRQSIIGASGDPSRPSPRPAPTTTRRPRPIRIGRRSAHTTRPGAPLGPPDGVRSDHHDPRAVLRH